MSDTLHDTIARIPGLDGWWHSYNEDTYAALAERLRGHGLDDDEIVAILTTAYGAAAAEFGS